MGIEIGSPNPGIQAMGMNRLKVHIDFTSASWNTVAAHRVFTQTGVVRTFIMYYVTGTANAGVGGTIAFGNTAVPAQYAAAQGFGNLTQGQLILPGGTVAQTGSTENWLLTATTKNSDNIAVGSDQAGGVNHGLTIAVAAFTAGTIDAYCFWTPISDGASIVAATGGAL